MIIAFGDAPYIPISEERGFTAQFGKYIPIGDLEIEDRLLKTIDAVKPVWHGKEESWSLGGNQGKITLALIDGKWMKCEGSFPSTHIIKPGVVGMNYQALVEFATMQVASEVNLNVANTRYVKFGDTDAIVIERYDRLVDGRIAKRIHQEDLCQALGYLSKDKYDVKTNDVMNLLKSSCPRESLSRFVNALFFNYLVGGTDAHAKNYSLLHLPGGSVVLSPLYDLASVLPYEKKTDRKWRHAAMSIGGENKIGALTGSDIERFAKTHDLPVDALKENMAKLAERIPPAIRKFAEEYGHVEGARFVVGEMERTIGANCKAMLANLNKTHHKGSFVRPGLAVINGGQIKRSAEPQAPRYENALCETSTDGDVWNCTMSVTIDGVKYTTSNLGLDEASAKTKAMAELHERLRGAGVSKADLEAMFEGEISSDTAGQGAVSGISQGKAEALKLETRLDTLSTRKQGR